MNMVRMLTYTFAGITALMLGDMLLRPDDAPVQAPRNAVNYSTQAVNAVQQTPQGPIVKAVSAFDENGVPVPSQIPETWDIIGIKIGMTPDDVKNALTAYRKDGRFWPNVERWGDDSQFTRTLFWDASTPDPADAKRKLSTETVVVVFTAPSSGNRAIAIKRTASYAEGTDVLLADRLRDSIHQKYGTSPEADRFGGDYTGVREKLMLDQTGQVITNHRAYGTPTCSVVVGHEVSDGLGIFDGTCGTVSMSWQIRGQRVKQTLIDSFTTEIKDIGFALGATTYDQNAYDKVRAETEQKRANGNAPRL